MYNVLKQLDDKRIELRKIYFHLRSQAKPNSTKCSTTHYNKMADDLDDFITTLYKLFR